MAVQRTYVYVDGFNVYYRALRGTPHKWLNIEALVQALLGPDNQIDMIRYFTAPVSGKLDADQPIRQDRYLRALRTLPSLTIHLGNFISKPKIRPLETSLADGTTHVRVINTEEKGSDVNFATYLVHDAWQDLYDVAVVLTQDTDLCEPLRIVRREIGKEIGLVWLDGSKPGKMANDASFVRHVTPARLAAAQFPSQMVGANGKAINKPAAW